MERKTDVGLEGPVLPHRLLQGHFSAGLSWADVKDAVGGQVCPWGCQAGVFPNEGQQVLGQVPQSSGTMCMRLIEERPPGSKGVRDEGAEHDRGRGGPGWRVRFPWPLPQTTTDSGS